MKPSVKQITIGTTNHLKRIKKTCKLNKHLLTLRKKNQFRTRVIFPRKNESYSEYFLFQALTILLWL